LHTFYPNQTIAALIPDADRFVPNLLSIAIEFSVRICGANNTQAQRCDSFL
jgi:hypothetical protein